MLPEDLPTPRVECFTVRWCTAVVGFFAFLCFFALAAMDGLATARERARIAIVVNVFMDYLL